MGCYKIKLISEDHQASDYWTALCNHQFQIALSLRNLGGYVNMIYKLGTFKISSHDGEHDDK